MVTIKSTIISQYYAALEMLKEAITQCPETLWDDPGYQNRTWHIAYHVLFYTHLYLHPSEAAFIPWALQRKNLQFMGRTPWPPYEKIERGDPYSQTALLDYLALCQQTVDVQIPRLDLEAGSGFDWLPLNKLELQFYNIRHLQHHTGELCERLGVTGAVEIDWVGLKPP